MPSEKSLNLAAFDVDGTITFTDSFMLFLRFYVGKSKFILNLILLLPVFILYSIKIINRDKAKNQILQLFFKGEIEKNYKAKCLEFADIYSQITRNDAIEAIKNHQKKGEIVALVSASLEDYLQPFAHKLDIEHVIATKMEIKNGILTGKMLGPNCRAAEKYNRIIEKFGNIKIIAAYGDSRGDKEMIEAAQNKYYRTLKDAPINHKKIISQLYWGNIFPN